MKSPIPDTFPTITGEETFPSYNSLFSEFQLRDSWCHRGMWAFVSWEWVDPFVKWIGNRKVLEVMAGAGWLARALREKGVEVRATDNYSWVDKKGWEFQTTVEKIDATEAVAQYGAQYDLLVISWPYMDPEAFKAIQKWEEVHPGGPIIYIGEGEGGCTADSDFHEHFEVVHDPAFECVTRKFRSWWGIHDEIALGKYK